jgi:hypothetical protein
MRGMSWFVVSVLVIFAMPPTVAAQPERRISVIGGIEYAHITEDDGFLGKGLGGSAGIALHLTRATSLEVEVGWERHRRDLGFHAVAFDETGRVGAFPYTARWAGTATFVLGLVSHTFGTAKVRPLVWVGGGLMHHGGTSRGPLTLPAVPPGYTLQPDELRAGRGRSSDALTLDGGAGVEIELTDRVGMRPFAGIRLVNTGNVGPKYIVRGGVRLAVHW